MNYLLDLDTDPYAGNNRNLYGLFCARRNWYVAASST